MNMSLATKESIVDWNGLLCKQIFRRIIDMIRGKR